MELTGALGQYGAMQARDVVGLVTKRLAGLEFRVHGTPVREYGKMLANRAVPVNRAAAVDLPALDVVRVLAVLSV